MLNNFILLYNKSSQTYNNIVSNNGIDTWQIMQNHSESYTIHSINNYPFLSGDILIGYDSKYGVTSKYDKGESIIIGDPYKLYPDSSESIIDIIQADHEDHKIYHTIGGAFAWIKLFSKEEKIEINTDMFGQLPLFYYHDEDIFAIATSIELLLQSIPSIPRDVNLERIIEFIVSGEVKDYYASFFKYIHRLKGNNTLTYDKKNHSISINQNISIDEFRDLSFSFTPQNLKKDMEVVINSATYDKKTAYSLSGGVDSTLLAAVGSSLSSKKITCFTASTTFGEDLKFSRLAASYMNAELNEINIPHNDQKIDGILEITRISGRPIHLWGNSIGTPTLAKAAKENNFEVLISGSAEHMVTGGLYVNNIDLLIKTSIKTHQWKKLFETLTFNHKNKLLSLKKVIKVVFSSFFKVKDNRRTYQSKLKGRDFNNFFNPTIQQIRDEIKINNINYDDLIDYGKNYLAGGGLQKFISQTYQSGNSNNISVRIPYLDTRLIKYLDNDRSLMLKYQYNKQIARDAMSEIMDPQVVYREDDQGLRWQSREFFRQNKDQIIQEIQGSDFLRSILSEKTLRTIEKPIFRKSILLALYSVALFDRSFHIKL